MISGEEIQNPYIEAFNKTNHKKDIWAQKQD